MSAYATGHPLPEGNQERKCSNAIAMNVDLLPLCWTFAGVDIPADIQGQSLKPILDNDGEKYRQTGEKPPIITIMSIRRNIRLKDIMVFVQLILN